MKKQKERSSESSTIFITSNNLSQPVRAWVVSLIDHKHKERYHLPLIVLYKIYVGEHSRLVLTCPAFASRLNIGCGLSQDDNGSTDRRRPAAKSDCAGCRRHDVVRHGLLESRIYRMWSCST